MAPGSGKRKRPDRQYSQEDHRPSPHRPEALDMAHPRGAQESFRGGRGGGRGGRRGGMYNSHPSDSRNGSRAPSPKPGNREQIAKQAQPPIPPPQITHQSIELVEDDPTEPPRPYSWDFLTEDAVASWKDSGRQTVLDSVIGKDYIATSILVQELVRAALDKRIAASDAGQFVRDVISKTNEDDLDVQSVFIDTISLLDDCDQKRKSLAVIVANTGIDLNRLRRELDVSLLQSLQLVRPTFDRMRTRKTTNVLYRQANFNLLREEPEGYAKLVTDYYETSQSAENGSDPEMAKESFNRIMALVGAFDLDVGRVLDITLDISANTLVKAYRFFVKFYRCSSWWPENIVVDNIAFTQDGPGNLPLWAIPGCNKWALDEADHARLAQIREERDVRFWEQVRSEGIAAFLELGGRKIVNYEAVLPLLEQEVHSEPDAKGRDITSDQRKRINENRKYMKATKMLPPSGNPDAAQLLGFKLRFYASSARNAKDNLPENLMYLAALLIKIGFISLRDLYPHLHPSDEDMEQEKERLEKEKQERDRKDRPGGGMNALLMAGALPDDTVPAVRNIRADAAKNGGSSPKPEKKVEEEDKEPGPPSNQKILILKGLLAIGALPEALFIIGKFPWLIDLDPTLPPFLHRLVNHMLHKVAQVVRPELKQDYTRSTKSQPIDMLSNVDGSLRSAPRPRIKMRRHLGLDVADNGDGFEERHYYTDWDDNVPVCQTIDDFFTLCDSFMNLLGVKIGLDSQLMFMFIRLARHYLKEDTSKANVDRWMDFIQRTLLPALSLSKHNPGVTEEMFELLSTFSISVRFRLYEEWYTGRTSRLPDIKTAFDKNRAEVKDVLRRITNQSGKVQARALAKVAFSSPGVVMMTFINQLESYSNMIPGLVDSVHYFNPLAFDVLTWVLIRSLNGQGRDRMQGDGMLTSAWLQALSTFVASLFTRYASVDPSPVLRYVASELRNGDSTDLELIDQIIAEMAGIRSEMNFNDAQLAAMTGGEVLQSVTIQQLGDIRHKRKSSAKRLMKALTTPQILGQMLVAIAQETKMYAHRESSKDMPLKVLGNNMDKIHQVLAQYLDMLRSNTTPAEFEAAIPDAIELIGRFGLEPVAAFTISRHIIAHHKTEVDTAKKQAEKDGTDTIMQETSAGAINADTAGQDAIVKAPWHPVFQDIANRLHTVRGDLAQRVNPHFFVTFWSLTPQDINCPLLSYEVERERVDTQRKEVSKDRSDTSAAAIKEREKKIAALDDRRKQLLAEQQDRLTAVKDTRVWLNTQKKHWFEGSDDEATKAARHLNLLQECFLPRALYSALDANYCSALMRILHSNNTPGFSLYSFLDQLLRKPLLSAIIYQCTAREAENFGRFVCEILKLLAHWHGSRKIYEHEAFGTKKEHTGFATEFNESGKPTAWLDYEEFRRILFGWHNAVKDAFKMCFESKEYMQIRNGIIVLKGVHAVFPALKFHGKAMQDAVKAISEEETRGDLKLAALSLQGPLKSREKKWVIPQDFKMSEMKETPPVEQPSGDTDMADDGSGKLNAEAPEFKPGASLNGDSRKNSNAAAEDGEIEDEKTQNVDVKMSDAPAVKVADVKAKEEVTKPPESIKQENPLPKRPDVPSSEAGRRTPSQAAARPPPPQANGRHSGRAEDRYGRLDRPSDMRPPLSRSRSPVSRSRERHNEVASEIQRIRREDRPPLKPPQADSRSFRDDHGRSPRPGETQERPSLPSGPSAQGLHPPSDTVNPARAALINGEFGPRDNRERRREERLGQDTRSGGRHIPTDDHRSEVAPTGPRAGRSGGRDLFDQSNGRNSVADSDRGRLTRDGNNSAPQAESSYGRLNGGSDSSPTARPPNGPARGPPGRNPRQRGPGGDRPATSSSNTDRAPASVPATPVNESGPAIHPSRLANLGATPTIDTSIPVQGSAGSPSAQPPSGPRAQGGRRQPGTPTGPSPTNGLPTGPSLGGDRQRRAERARGQAVAQSPAGAPNGQGTQFRGAARQPGHGSATTSALGPTEQPRAIASSMDVPSHVEPTVQVHPGRQELIARSQQNNERGDRQRPSRNSSRERRAGGEAPRYNGQQHGGQGDRVSRDMQPREKRAREDDAAPGRRPPNVPGAYAQPNQDWNGRGPRLTYEDHIRGASHPRGAEDFRAPRRPDDGRRDEHIGGQENHGRKRHSDEGPPFDAKRRRSGR